MTKHSHKSRQIQDHSRLPYFQFYTDDWLAGTVLLNYQEKGFYIDLLATLWSQKGPIPYSQIHLAMRCDPRRARRLVDRLIALSKVSLDADNRIYNAKLMALLQAQCEPSHPVGLPSDLHMEVHTEIEQKSANTAPEKQAKSTNPRARARSISISISKEEESPNGDLSSATPNDVMALEAFQAWNAMALKAGLPQAAKLTPDRKRKIRARLRDHGPDSWARALANIERSKFLRGEDGDREWRANLDFLLQPASYAKVVDGAYGNGAHAEPVDVAAHLAGNAEVDRLLADLDRKLRM